MRVKSVPVPPESLDTLETARRSIPLVPEPESSCRKRLVSRIDSSSEDARDWLTFLEGLGLVRESQSGYYRTRENSSDLGEALFSGVYGAREIYEILHENEQALSAGEAFERFEAIPRWERHHRRDPEAVWCDRIERLLGWLMLVDRVQREAGGYSLRESRR
jgi:hypothetical protein